MPPSSLRFASYRLDLQSGELWRDGHRLLLPEQPFRILVALLRRPGALVTREALCRELWPDGTFVDFEHSLNAAVKRLREYLGDSASTPVFIETVPRRGYRFVAPVIEDIDDARPDSTTGAASPLVALDRSDDLRPSDHDGRSPWGRSRTLAVLAAAVLVVVSAVAWTVMPTSVTGPANGSRLVRLTSASGVNADPSVSPDGGLLAFASDRAAGDLDIWVQTLTSTAQPIRLTTEGTDESEPSFSPDGSEIVYSQRDSGLFVVGALGGQRRLVTRASWARNPRFAPDGRAIVYWTGFPASVVAGGIPEALGSMFLVPASGGTAVPLTTPLASARYPIWSPDGSHLLFLGEEDPDQKIHDWYVMSRDGGAVVKTGAVDAMRTAGLRTSFPIPSAWLPSTGAVVFASNETDSSNLWQIAIDPGTGRVAGRPEPLTYGTAIERQPAAARGGRVVFTTVVENVDVWRLPMDPRTGVAVGEPERVTHDAASDRLRNVSTDGRRITFISSRTGRDELWLKDLATGNERQVTRDGIDDASASADGLRAALSRRDGARSTIDIVDIDGGAPTGLCDQCYAPSDWSPDGTALLVSQGRPSRLTLFDLPAGRARELAAHPMWSAQLPRFSPDGRWVAFHTANSPNVRQVHAVPLASATAVPPAAWVTVVSDHGCHPSWSPDGSLVFHFSFRDGAFCPWVQRVNPVTKRPVGDAYAVTHLHHGALRAASGAAAFNDVQGGYLYLSLTQAASQIWMLDR